MDALTILVGCLVSISGCLGLWQLVALWGAIKEQRDVSTSMLAEVNVLKNDLARHDERGRNFQKSLDSIFELLRTINDKLDRKADK